MEILAIILLIFFGIVLLLLEFLVIPGTTIAGIGGILLMAGGVYMSYDTYGNTIGHYTLLGTFLFIVTSLYLSFKTKTWKKLMLKSSINGKIDTFEDSKINVGDEGISVSRLAPMGKVLINNTYIEAQSPDKFIDENTKVIVTKVLSNKIVVKSKT